MPKLAYIRFQPWLEAASDDGNAWERDVNHLHIDRLPQIFWNSGEGWPEANYWALKKVSDDGVDLETVKSLMKHLFAYSEFLEKIKLDWRHFPIRMEDRVLVRFRGHLIKQIKSGNLRSSTASARIHAVIQFYRHADELDLIAPEYPMWRDKNVAIPFFDAAGFKRTLTRASTSLAIKNRTHLGTKLEDGLQPLSEQHMRELLTFTLREASEELHLLLTTGFFVGARFETITTIRIENLEAALPDPYIKGFHQLNAGPGTGIQTKFDVQGRLLLPDFLLAELLRYAYSTQRLKREARASPSDRSLLFLTSRGNRYGSNSVSRLMTDLRRDASRAGLKFMSRFKFHETRATYGTWLMKIMLGITSVPTAIEFVKSAMFHKHESTTFGYVKFIESSKGKEQAAAAFSEAFSGLTVRNWDDFHA
ncbi:site-specific integrase [Roseateles puraquae]|uniref:site-specific integrase n=1 Tax=Roseateles puraquae TaxID=431059 RepID=UPI0031D0BC94